MQADIGEPCALDRGERLGHAVDERLDADEAGARIALGLRDQMLAAAEADFEADVIDRRRKQRRADRPAPACEIERKPRQQRLEQRGLARPQRMPLRRPKKAPRALVVAAVASLA